jgi:hypothetical protein
MRNPYHNDQAYIAERFLFLDDHTTQSSRLAFLKINSYKLSLINSAFCKSKDELTGIIKGSLLNYTAPSTVLSNLGFFLDETEN